LRIFAYWFVLGCIIAGVISTGLLIHILFSDSIELTPAVITSYFCAFNSCACIWFAFNDYDYVKQKIKEVKS